MDSLAHMFEMLSGALGQTSVPEELRELANTPGPFQAVFMRIQIFVEKLEAKNRQLEIALMDEPEVKREIAIIHGKESP